MNNRSFGGCENGSGFIIRLIEAGFVLLVLSLILARGTYREALWVVALGLVLKFIECRKLIVPANLKWALGLIAVLWGWGGLSNHGSYLGSGNALLWCFCLLLGMFQMPSKLFSSFEWRDLLGPLLLIFVVANGLGDLLYDGPIYIGRGRPGLFSNIHYLSEYVVLTVPALVLVSIKSRGWPRLIYLAALVGDLALLVLSKSRPGFVAGVASALVLIPLVAPMARLWIIGGMSLVLGGLYWGDIGDFSERMDDLFMNLREDERAEIWMNVFDMFMVSTQKQWLFGHGLGQFMMDFHSRGIEQQFRIYLSPHNFAFEILYSHGVLGLLIVVIAMLTLLGLLVRSIGGAPAGRFRLEGFALLSTWTASVAHGIFTIPFFSRDFLLPFGLLVGLVLLYIGQARKMTSN